MTEERIPYGENIKVWNAARELAGMYFMCPPKDPEQRGLYYSVFTILKHVPSSGVIRVIDLYIIRDNVPIRISWEVAVALEKIYDRKHEGVRIGNLGKDVGLSIVNELSRKLFCLYECDHEKAHRLKEINVKDSAALAKVASENRTEERKDDPVKENSSSETPEQTDQEPTILGVDTKGGLRMPEHASTLEKLFKSNPRLAHIKCSLGTQEEADDMGIMIFSRDGSMPSGGDTQEQPDEFQQSLHEQHLENMKELFPEEETMSTETSDDVGPEVIRFIYKSMLIDETWSIKAPRGFTWWGHQLAQRIWAEDCRRDEGVDVTLMYVETDFLRNVENNQQTFESLNDLNAGASQFAFIYDANDRCIRFHSTIYCHRQNLDWSKRLFLNAVGLQISYAERMVESFSRLFTGSEPDTSPHPDNGNRQVKDELVGLIDSFFIPRSKEEPPIESSIFKFAEEKLQSAFMVSTGDNGLTAEFPFSGNEPVAVLIAQGKLGVVTSLFLVNSSEGHPLLGRGLMMRMMLPVSYDREAGLQIAMALNKLEAREWARCHLNGAWYVDHKSQLVFTSFFPIKTFEPWELVNLALSFAIRSRWASEVLREAEEDHDSMTGRMLH